MTIFRELLDSIQEHILQIPQKQSAMQPTSSSGLMGIANKYIILIALSLILALLFLPQSLTGIVIFDEGFIVSGGMVVKNGGLPYRDFLSMYGPGQYYIVAAIFSLFGEQLLHIRVLHVVLLAAIGMAIYKIAQRPGSGTTPPLLTLLGYVGVVLFAQPNVGYPAITATLFLLLSVLAFIGWLESRQSNRLILVSCMIGIAGLFRWDFGVFGLAALLLTVASMLLHERRKSNQPAALFPFFVAAIGPAAAIAAAVYIPLLVVLSSPARWYGEVLLYSAQEFPKWRSIEFIRPVYWDFSSKNPLVFFGSFLKFLYLGIPIFLVICSLGTAIYSYMQKQINPIDTKRIVLMVYLAFLCLFLLNQMRVRPHLWQGFSAAVMSIPLIPLLWDYHRAMVARSKPLSWALKIGMFVPGALLFNISLYHLLATKGEGYVPFDTPRSSMIRVEPKQKPYSDLVHYVRSITGPGEPIYSGVQDHSRLFINDAMLYFLTDRPPADRFLELEPGISNTRTGQQEIVDAIKHKNVKVIVLSNILSDEPNLTSRSNGVMLLDEFIHANFHYDKSFGNQKVFRKN